jgi:hypothetical protein
VLGVPSQEARPVGFAVEVGGVLFHYVLLDLRDQSGQEPVVSEIRRCRLLGARVSRR